MEHKFHPSVFTSVCPHCWATLCLNRGSVQENAVSSVGPDGCWYTRSEILHAPMHQQRPSPLHGISEFPLSSYNSIQSGKQITTKSL